MKDSNSASARFWRMQHKRLKALRELYRERGVLVLSPSVLNLWGRRSELEDEVIQLRNKTIEAVERLDEQDSRYRAAQIDAIKNTGPLDTLGK